MQYWLKVAGTGKSPITDPDWYAVSRRWGERHGFFSGFPKRPSVARGDRLVAYAAGSGRVFGAPGFTPWRRFFPSPSSAATTNGAGVSRPAL